MACITLIRLPHVLIRMLKEIECQPSTRVPGYPVTREPDPTKTKLLFSLYQHYYVLLIRTRIIENVPGL